MPYQPQHRSIWSIIHTCLRGAGYAWLSLIIRMGTLVLGLYAIGTLPSTIGEPNQTGVCLVMIMIAMTLSFPVWLERGREQALRRNMQHWQANPDRPTMRHRLQLARRKQRRFQQTRWLVVMVAIPAVWYLTHSPSNRYTADWWIALVTLGMVTILTLWSDWVHERTIVTIHSLIAAWP